MRKISCIALILFLFAAAYAAAGAEGESAAAGDGPLVMSMFITLGERQQSMAPGENRLHRLPAGEVRRELRPDRGSGRSAPGEAEPAACERHLSRHLLRRPVQPGRPDEVRRAGGADSNQRPDRQPRAGHREGVGAPAGAAEVDGDPGRQHLQHSGGGGVLPLQREPEALDQHHLAGQARPRHARHHRRVRGGADGVPG